MAVIFPATGEHSTWPYDAKEPEPRSNRARALTLEARTLNVWWPPPSQAPSGSTRLATTCRAPSSVLGSQDANAISIIIKGNEAGFLRRRFLMFLDASRQLA